MVRASVVAWLVLLGGCRLYDPVILDCQVRCGLAGQCPADTTCSASGFCRPVGATGVCDCLPGEVQVCPLTAGLIGAPCTGGTRTCQPDRRWSACQGAVGPRTEVCNGVDDDCDGIIDSDALDAPRCPLREGVCAVPTYATCVGGRFLPCNSREYGYDYQDDETRCDGLDNDCDGHVDGLPLRRVGDAPDDDWFLVPVAGEALLVTREGDAGTKLTWFTRRLDVRATEWLDAGHPIAVASDRLSYVMAWRDDAGMFFRWVSHTGQVLNEHRQPGWRDATDLSLSTLFAAAVVDGGVEFALVQVNDGPRFLGASDGGAPRMSQSGLHVAWAGGVARTNTGVPLPGGAIEPLVALVEFEGGEVRAVPERAPFRYFRDLRVSRDQGQFSSGISARAAATDGRRLLAVGDGANATWLFNENASTLVAPYTTTGAVKLATVPDGVIVGLAHDGGLWLTQRCVP